MQLKISKCLKKWGKTTSKLELKTFFARNGKSFFQSKLHQIFWLSAPSDGSLYVWLHIASFILDPAFDYFAFVFCDFLISNSVKLSVIIGVTKKLFNLWSKFICLFTTGWRSGCALQYRWWMGHLQYLVIWCVQLLGFKIQEIHFEISVQCSPVVWRICQRNLLQSCIGSLQLTNHFNCKVWPPKLAHCAPPPVCENLSYECGFF